LFRYSLYVHLFQIFSSNHAIVEARKVESHLLTFSPTPPVFLLNRAIETYGKCGCLMGGTWNAMITASMQGGCPEKALSLFSDMNRSGVYVSEVTFTSVLGSCGAVLALCLSRLVHGLIAKYGFVANVILESSVVDVFEKCQVIKDGRRMFDEIKNPITVSWNVIVRWYLMMDAVFMFFQIFQTAVRPFNFTFCNALNACSSIFALKEGKQIHGVAIKMGSGLRIFMRNTTKDIDYVTIGLILNVCAGLSDVEVGKQVHGFIYQNGFPSNLVVGNAPLDMYGQCGNLRSAGVCVSWNVLLTSYARHGLSEQAMAIFSKMQWETRRSKNGYEMDIVIRGALVDMYSKCCCLEYAFTVFEEAASQDVILWNSILFGCSHNQRGRVILELFRLMEEEGILLACMYEGLVELGTQYFNSMSNKYCVMPRLEHYGCMIELYSRYGHINELEEFIKIPFEPTVPMLTKVFDICRKYGCLRLGEWAAERLNELNSSMELKFQIMVKERK
ncbi:hypothetical protein ACB092_12G135200, partial [Castanea dentata]